LHAPLGKDLHGTALTSCIVATGADGYKVVLSLAEIDPDFHPGVVLVADAMNGHPLDEKSGPFKLIVTGDKRPARWVRNLVSIELKSLKQDCDSPAVFRSQALPISNLPIVPS
jgi:hypothetical protein